MYDFNAFKVENNESENILERFKSKYINESYPERMLLINHLNNIDKKISINQIRELSIPADNSLFMYHERLKILYRTDFESICLYVEQLEPWEDVDCLIFDCKLEWYLGITHNDTLLIYGI